MVRFGIHFEERADRVGYYYYYFRFIWLCWILVMACKIFDPIDGSPLGSCLWDSPGKNTGVGCLLFQCMKVKSESEVAQSSPTLSDPMDCSLPGSSVHGIFQARVLEWGATAFSEIRRERGIKNYPDVLT